MNVEAMILIFESFRGLVDVVETEFLAERSWISGSNSRLKEKLISALCNSPTVRRGSEVIKTLDDPGKFRARYCNLICVALG